MIAPDHITSTAPKRIYLDLGDCAHLIKPEETFATYAQGEVTWSAGNDSGVGIPYVRADLAAPTSSASGALPAEEREAFERWYCEDAASKGCKLPDGIEDLRTGDEYGNHRVMLNGKWLGWQGRAALASREASPAPLTGTPAAEWRTKGEPDPHAGRYDCERAALMLGELTDDELANGAFMNYDVRLSFDDLVNPKPGQYPPIAWMTAVKDRIRWLSRALEAALASPQVAPAPEPVANPNSIYELAAMLPEGVSWHDPITPGLVQHIMALATPAPVAPTPDEQAAFEDWLEETCPSGDVTEVQRKWENSSEYRDLYNIPDPVQVAPTLTDEQLDAIAIARYTVVPNPDKVFGYAVHVGNGRGACYRGHRTECEAVAARMRGAFLDGAYVARHPDAAPVAPTTAQPSEWQSCDVEPMEAGYYEMRAVSEPAYTDPVLWEGRCWYDLDGEAIQFHPLNPSHWEWRRPALPSEPEGETP